MSAVLARPNEMGLETRARRSAGQYLVVDEHPPCCYRSAVIHGPVPARGQAGNSPGVEELAFDIAVQVEMVAEVTGP